MVRVGTVGSEAVAERDLPNRALEMFVRVYMMPEFSSSFDEELLQPSIYCRAFRNLRLTLKDSPRFSHFVWLRQCDRAAEASSLGRPLPAVTPYSLFSNNWPGTPASCSQVVVFLEKKDGPLSN